MGHEEEQGADGKLQENGKISREMQRVERRKDERTKNFREAGGENKERGGRDSENEIKRKDIECRISSW